MIASRTIALLATVLLVLAACATSVQVPEIPILDESVPFKAAKREAEKKPAVKIVEVSKPLPLPGQLKPIPEKKERSKDDKPPKERVAEANALARIDPVKDGYINAIQVYPYTKGALYQLYAAPSQVTDIALEPGEKLVSVSAGDTVRWVVGDTTSGEGKGAQVHILVKPIGPELETNLVIATDRRTYHLEMRSSDKTYMASVSWTYPAAELITLRKQQAEADVAGTVVADNDRKSSDGAPDFRIALGTTEIGAAWRRTKQGTDQTYLRVRLDDPAWPQPIWAALLEGTDDAPARLFWRRDRKDDG